MKFFSLLSLACVACMTLAAPVEQEGAMMTASCVDPFAVSAAGLALGKINMDRQEGYVLALHRLANVNQMAHAETGVVFYLTMDVVETDCHVLTKANWRNCSRRPMEATPVYGQCKAVIYVNRPQRVVRLYTYKCLIRPVPFLGLLGICPDCPTHSAFDDTNILKAMTLSLDKFNKESGLSHRFLPGKISRAVSQGGIMEAYIVEYTIQESTCAPGDVSSQNCPLMDCEFAHKGFCKGSHTISHGEEFLDVACTLYEPETAEKQKTLHQLGGETDHSHTDTASIPHDHAHSHDHAHDHTKGDPAHAGQGSPHMHPNPHTNTHSHAHTHTPGQAHDADHVHSHHAKAHNHTGDSPKQHHQYTHADDVHSHDHDHDLALDHDHKHAHLHEHEHHHHHHHGDAGTPAKHPHHPDGVVLLLPAMDDTTTTMPTFPPEMATTKPDIPDPDIMGQTQPAILPFPGSQAAACPGPLTEGAGNPLVDKAFADDPLFKPAA
ncbi:unnamed protein product [Boreogadus saida]